MKSLTSLTLAVSIVFFAALMAAFAGADRTLFLPAPLSSAHQRFEAGCEACHEPWKGAVKTRCLGCHSRQMENDLHSAAKLIAPVKASVPDNLKQLECLECHREHRKTAQGLYSGPPGMCVLCHKKAGISGHDGFADGSCADPGCHSYHSGSRVDKVRSSYPGRLKPASETVAEPEPVAPQASPAEIAAMRQSVFYVNNPLIVGQYEIGAHSGTKATCSKCHEQGGAGFKTKPSISVCGDCHRIEYSTYVSGKHGAPDGVNMGVSIMESRNMGCGACHDVHSVSLERTGMEACLDCHKSEHAGNYEKSGHHRYMTDPVFALNPVRGIACAGCHMPRLARLEGATDHNETHAGSSRYRMAEDVCQRCHGLKYALTGVFDDALIKSGFSFTPSGVPGGLGYLFSLAARPPSAEPGAPAQ